MPTALTTAPKPLSCVRHRPYGRFHIIYEDFEDISAHDLINASVQRIVEQKTDERAQEARARYGIPSHLMPPDDMLWIEEEELSLRILASWSLGLRSKSSFARALRDRNLERQPKSLIQLGLVQRRFVARRANREPLTAQQKQHVMIHKDEQGLFLIVDDERGNYIGLDGLQYNAAIEGWGKITKQFLYCFDEVNAAIAALDGLQYEPLPRWDPAAPPQAQKKASRAETHRNNSSSGPGNAFDSNEMNASQGGSLKPAAHFTFENQNTISDSRLSIVLSSSIDPCPKLDSPVQHQTTMSNTASSGVQNWTEPSSVGHISKGNKGSKVIQNNTKKDSVLLSLSIDLEALRIAPKSPETILGLVSQILAVPPRPDASDAEALAAWNAYWHEPAAWLCNATDDVTPRQAWMEIEHHIQGMINGPTWYARERTGQTPITLRHVVGPASLAKPLSGCNWRVVHAELSNAGWYADPVVLYDGPLPTIYEQGYMGTATPPPEPERPQGMSRDDAQLLCNEIWQSYSQLTLTFAPLPGSEERVYVGFEYGPEQWFDLDSFEAWRSPNEETQKYLALALAFVGGTATTDEIEAVRDVPPIAAMEPPHNDAPPPPAQDAPLPGKAGMSRGNAEWLQGKIVDEGYTVQLCDLGGDRAILQVEVGPGAWIDIERAAQWRQFKSGGGLAPAMVMQSSPGLMAVAQ